MKVRGQRPRVIDLGSSVQPSSHDPKMPSRASLNVGNTQPLHVWDPKVPSTTPVGGGLCDTTLAVVQLALSSTPNPKLPKP